MISKNKKKREMGKARSEIHELGMYSKSAYPKHTEPRKLGLSLASVLARACKGFNVQR